MTNWKTYKLGEVVNIKHGYAYKGDFFSIEPTNDILVTPGNFNIGGGFKADKFKYYKGETPDNYVLNPGDVIVTMTDLSKDGDTLGYPALVPEITGKRLLHNQRIGLLQFKKEDFSKEFIYWLMRTKYYQSFVLGTATGTTVKHTAPTRIQEYTFTAPDLSTQRRIAEILSALDDKIELNRRMNQTLEQMAQTLFRQYFVDGIDEGNLPEGWRLGLVKELFELQRGFDLPSTQRVSGIVPVFAASGMNGFHNSPMVKGPGITTGRSGVIGNVFYIQEDFWPLNTSLFIKDFKLSTPLHAFFVLRYLDLKGMNSGSAVPTLNRNEVHSLQVVIPPYDLILKFEELIKPLFHKIRLNEKESEKFAIIRDTLLPKLMSGEIDVMQNKAEDLYEPVFN